MATDNNTPPIEDADNLKNFSTSDVAHHGASDEDPTSAKDAGGLVHSDLGGPHSDSGDRHGSTGAFGAGGGGSDAGPVRAGVDEESGS